MSTDDWSAPGWSHLLRPRPALSLSSRHRRLGPLDWHRLLQIWNSQYWNLNCSAEGRPARCLWGYSCICLWSCASVGCRRLSLWWPQRKKFWSSHLSDANGRRWMEPCSFLVSRNAASSMRRGRCWHSQNLCLLRVSFRNFFWGNVTSCDVFVVVWKSDRVDLCIAVA